MAAMGCVGVQRPVWMGGGRFEEDFREVECWWRGALRTAVC